MLDILALIIGRQAAGQLLGNIQTLGETALLLAVSLPVLFLIVGLVVTPRAALRASPSQSLSILPPLRESIRRAFYIDLRAHPSFKWWFINRFLFWCAFSILGTFLLLFTISVIGLPEHEAQIYLGNLAVVLGGAILFISLPSGRLADRFGRKPLLIVAGFLAAVGTVMVLLVRDLTLLTLGGGLIGLAAGIFISASFALITDIVPSAEAARFMGVASVAGAAGGAFARFLGGAIVDPINILSSNTATGYLALYAIAGVFFLLSAFAALRIPKRQATNS